MLIISLFVSIEIISITLLIVHGPVLFGFLNTLVLFASLLGGLVDVGLFSFAGHFGIGIGFFYYYARKII